jgi:hypothetical protein
MSTTTPITISEYRHVADTHPSTLALPWPELAEYLAERARSVEVRAKRALPAWSPHVLTPGATRLTASVQAITLLVLDVDGWSLDAAREQILARGWAALLYGSPSDDETKPLSRRFRIVVPITEPLTTPEYCRSARLWASEALGIPTNAGPKGAPDAARLFFLGGLLGEPKRFSEVLEGEPVDLNLPPLTPEDLVKSPAKSKRARARLLPVQEAHSSAQQTAVTLLWGAYASGERHELVRAIGGYLGRRGWGDERVTDLVCELPSDQVPLRVSVAVDSARRARAGEAAPGWEVLCARLGEDSAEEFRAAVKDPCEPDGFRGVWSSWWACALAPGGWVERARGGAKPEGGDAFAAPAHPDLVFDLTPGNIPRATHTNVCRVLEHLFGDRIFFDEFRSLVILEGVPKELGRFPDGAWVDEVTTALHLVCEGLGLRVSDGVLWSSVCHHARLHARNPLADLLRESAEAWDGVERVDKAMHTYWGAEDTGASEAASRVFLLSLVARALDPGCRMETALVLIGPQDKFKSQSLEFLAGGFPYFANSKIVIGDKDALQNMRGAWLWEDAEGVAIMRALYQEVRGFLSSRSDTYRPSYGHHTIQVPRTCVFAVTTNNGAPLKDPKGARRFLPVEVARAHPLDLEGIKRDRLLLLGEATSRYLAHEQFWPRADETAALLGVRTEASAGVVDAWEEAIVKWCEAMPANGKICSQGDIFDEWKGAVAKRLGDVTQAHKLRASAIMRRIGWVPCLFGRVRGWRQGTPEETEGRA